MAHRTVLLALTTVVFAASGNAADVVLAIDEFGFSPASLTMKAGDRLVVTNQGAKRQYVWGQGMSDQTASYAFDFRSTRENNWTHEPDQALGIVLNIPGKYRIGNVGPLRAAVTVEP